MGRGDSSDGEGMRDSHHPRAHSFPSLCFSFAFSATSCGVKRCCECWLCCCERFLATFLSIGLSSNERWMQHVACLIFMILIIAIFSVHLMKSCFLLHVKLPVCRQIECDWVHRLIDGQCYVYEFTVKSKIHRM